MSDKTPKAPRPVIEQAAPTPGQPEAADAAEAASRAATAPSAPTPEPAPETAPEVHVTGGFQDTTWGFIEGMGKRAWSYADGHPHTVLYGAIGLILAVLILVLGLWRTIVIAIFVGVGAGIGQMRDGRGGLYNIFSRIFGGR